LDKGYPGAIFTVVIWSNDRAKFDEPEVECRDQTICVTGKSHRWRDAPDPAVAEAGPTRPCGTVLFWSPARAP